MYAGIRQGTLNDAYIMKGAMLRDAGELEWTPFLVERYVPPGVGSKAPVFSKNIRKKHNYL